MHRTRTPRSLRLALLFALLPIVAPSAREAGAATIEIQFTGLDLSYDGETIRDVSPGADPLTSLTMAIDGTPLASSPLTSGVSADLQIPGVTNIAIAGDSVPATGGTMRLNFGGGDYLELALEEVLVNYVPTPSTVSFVFGGTIAEIVSQSMPEGIEIGAPTTLSFSGTLGSRTHNGLNILTFRAVTSGQVSGLLVPEPAAVAIGLASVAAAAVLMRLRLG